MANSSPFPDTDMFMAGDIRGNENIELTAIQTLFMREHNRQASILAKLHPDWTDEQLYQGARQIVIAEIQSITFNEYLPALLGRGTITPYAGYDPDSKSRHRAGILRGRLPRRPYAARRRRRVLPEQWLGA